jgi:hypothetical protein
LAIGHRPVGLQQAEPRPGADRLGGQGGEPAGQGGALAAGHGRGDVLLDHPQDPLVVVGGQRVVDGVVAEPVRLAPGGRGVMQLGHPVGPLALQAGPQKLGEQVMVAPPAAHLVQRDQEQVGPLGLLQQLLAVAAATDGVA